jgi:hypothetical protein
MDPALVAVLKVMQDAGPSAGLGFALGLLIMVAGLYAEKLVPWGRFVDMREQRNSLQREKETLDRENRSLEAQNSELRVMVAGALNVARKNAHLSTSVMQRAVGERETEHAA